MKIDSLAHKAYVEIRRKILSAQISPKARLKEDFWAKRLSVSRMAIRETLTRLLGEQLVTVGPKGGYFVNSLTPKDIIQIRELREVLELGALRLACAKISKEEIAKLEKICKDFSAMVAQGYYAGACEADLKFHETLVESSGNEKLLKTYINSHIPLFQRRLALANNSENDYDLTDKEHRAIVKALKQRNLKKCEKIMKLHFARGVNIIHDHFDVELD
jgi:DNA-binding GntR family transcriptional regulator